MSGIRYSNQERTMPPIKEDYLFHSRDKAEKVVAILLSTLTVSRAWVRAARVNNEFGYAVGVTVTEAKGGDQFWFDPQLALAHMEKRTRGAA